MRRSGSSRAQPRAALKIRPRQRPLWRCPRCGRLFVTRNIYHGCGPYTVAGFLTGKGPRARAFYRGFVALLRRCGPIIAAPAKTRVAFMVRVRFAGISALSEQGMTIAFALTRPLASPRVQRIGHYSPKWYGHYLRITDPKQLDAELLGWLRESYRMGEQRHLAADGTSPSLRRRDRRRGYAST